MQPGNDHEPLVQIGSAAKEIGKVAVIATKVVGGDADGRNYGGTLRKCVSNLKVKKQAMPCDRARKDPPSAS